MARRLAALSTAPPPTLNMTGPSMLLASAMARVLGRPERCSPSWSKISATVLPAGPSTSLSVSTTA